MCLSTVYKNEMVETAIVMKNVMQIQCKDGCVILTDLMDREVSISVSEGAGDKDGRLPSGRRAARHEFPH